MNETQSVIIKMFTEFVSVCENLGLKWYMINGSALGAVKYNGFIPWDDDLDVGMPRKDYEIFLKKAQELLPKHIFLQNYRTDKNFPHIYSKLRNSNTTFIEQGVAHLDINHGIFLDIFPLDCYPEDKKVQKKLEFNKKIFVWKGMCSINDTSNFKIRFRNSLFKILRYHKKTSKVFAKFDNLVSSFEGTSSLICNHGDRMNGKSIIKSDIYGNGKTVYFEGIKVNIPEKYDEYLTHKYGNWRADPPKEQQNSHHHTTICDPKKPYSEYIGFK